jgi:hypothetical protein
LIKVANSIPQKAKSFEELLKSILTKPSEMRCRLLKTAQETGFLSDDMLLTRLSNKERSSIEQKHWDALISDTEYAKATPMSLGDILPRRLTCEVERAKFVGGDEFNQLVSLRSGDLRVFVEAEAFLTLKERHPEAVWRFSSGEYWKKPLVLLEGKGFLVGNLLGLLATVPIKIEYSPQKNNRSWQLTSRWRYTPIPDSR